MKPKSSFSAAAALAMSLMLSSPAARAADPVSTQQVTTISKTVTRSVSTLLYPTASQPSVDVARPFEWRVVSGAEGYALDIGTGPGGEDVFSTGEIDATSIPVPASLPRGRNLYARVWTYVSGTRYPSPDVLFSIPLRATMAYPLSGNPDVDFLTRFSWTAVAGSRGYELTIGTRAGASDVFDSGATSVTSALVPSLPTGGYFGRISTLTAGQPQWQDFTFQSTGSPIAILTYPAAGSSNVDIATPFTWTAIPNAAAYHLTVGTTPGANDLADTGDVNETSFVMPVAATPGWARLWTYKFGRWRYSDAPFTTGAPIPNVPVYPADGAVGIDTGRPFEWSGSPLANAYRLEIGMGPGLNNLLDTGEIAVLQRYTGNLPIGGKLYGRVSARYGETWSSVDFTFTTSANGPTSPWVVAAALKATAFVRQMANEVNEPVKGSLLDEELTGLGFLTAACTDYAATLRTVLDEMRSPASDRRLDICMNPNQYECHTLVEMLEPVSGSWMLLDPTFGLTVKRTSNGSWATQEDVSNATQSQRWGDVTYVFLGSFADSVAQNYYLDYPLLYLNTYPNGEASSVATARSVLPYMDLQTTLPGTKVVYALRAPKPGTFVALVDGEERSVACTGANDMSYMFFAADIEMVPGAPTPLQVYRPHRFVFTSLRD